MRVLMMGCGKLGSAVGLGLAAQGHQVWAARRKAGLIPKPLCPLKVKLEEGRGLQSLPRGLDLAVYCITASEYSDAGYAEAYPTGLQRFLDALPDEPAVLFVSSTSVYHQNNHEWVSEDSPTRPQGFSGKRILQAECVLAASRFRGASVRFAGIYGPQPGRLVQRVRSGFAYPKEPLHYSNRIHFDDAVGVLLHLTELLGRGDKWHPCYLAADCKPAPRHEVTDWLREQLNVVETGSTDAATADTGRRAGSKRCGNSLLLQSGYRFIHSDYKSGYSAVLAGDM